MLFQGGPTGRKSVTILKSQGGVDGFPGLSLNTRKVVIPSALPLKDGLNLVVQSGAHQKEREKLSSSEPGKLLGCCLASLPCGC